MVGVEHAARISAILPVYNEADSLPILWQELSAVLPACSLRALRRECLQAIPPFDGMHRFIPTLLRMAGYRVVEVPVTHRPRRFGRSKYGIRNRAVRAFKDLLAVRWMMRRQLRYEIAEELGEKS